MKYKRDMLLRFILVIAFLLFLQACFTSRWYSIEQEPAQQMAYIHASVFVTNDYIRSTLIHEIDGEEVENAAKGKLEINVGTHRVKIFCDEAKGNYDSDELKGQSKELEFEAFTQRTYKALCLPYSHWWIEDSENGKVVAGQKPVT